MRHWISISLLAVACSGCGESNSDVDTTAQPRVAIGNEINVSGGAITGLVGTDGLKQYHGIPYAAPPIGDLRWAPTQPAIAWDNVRDATAPGPACMQPQGQGGSFYGDTGFAMDEDCLFVNVWTRAEYADEALPVMVWVHGGALVTGSGDGYPGELLTSKGVVLVTINYRLGRFGFHAHPDLSAQHPSGVSGNQGLRDQIAALEWVQDNVAQFGGDPANVTIFGESAGSLSMSLLQASPLAHGLFHRVIGQSGGAFQPMWYRERRTNYASSAEEVGEAFAAALAGEGGDRSLAAVRAIPQEHVLEVFESHPDFGNYDSLAIVDGEVIPQEVATIFANGAQTDVPVMIGSNANEATTFLDFFIPLYGEGEDLLNGYAEATLGNVAQDIEPYYPADDPEEAWINLFGDVLFTHPMRVWARGMQNVKSDAYLYWFTWAPPVPDADKYRAFHAGEIGYVFGNLDLFGAVPTDRDRAFADVMATLWTQFAKTGNPNGPGLPEWPAYDPDTEPYMELGVDIGKKAELRIGEVDLIERAWAAKRDGSQ